MVRFIGGLMTLVNGDRIEIENPTTGIKIEGCYVAHSSDISKFIISTDDGYEFELSFDEWGVHYD